MPLLSALRTLYSWDTLDPRLTTGTLWTAPPKPSAASLPTRDSGESPQSRKLREQAHPSRWKKPEFMLYYVVLATCLPMMLKVTYDLSKESHPSYKLYERLLSPGWIPGRRVDNSDGQYKSFRNNIPILFGVLFLHTVLRRGFNVIYNAVFPAPLGISSYLAAHNLSRRRLFDIIFALMFLTALHGLSVLKILFILLVNFLISYFHPSSTMNPIMTWVFNIGILFANERYRGYRFRDILPGLIAGEGSGVGYAMDHVLNGGLLRRWEISFNITVLRLISYNLDHYWAAVQAEEGEEGSVVEVGDLSISAITADSSLPSVDEVRQNGGVEADVEAGVEERLIEEVKKRKANAANASDQERIENPADMSDYGLLNYLAYALYSPLYLAGPIITFNDFVHQQRYSSSSISSKRTLLYAIRLAIAILAMEFVLHYFYVVAISKTSTIGSWTSATPFQLAMIGYFNLHIIWLKLLIPWRFFRLWSLVDGVDPLENMLRCCSNNYSTTLFWRSWHRSFNHWIMRYIYIPFGGGRRRIINNICVFTFVALWHDLSLKLLAWGWLIVLFVVPEITARKIFHPKRFEGREALYRVLSGLGGVVNVTTMMMANLVGYAIGVDGVKQMIQGIVSTWGGIGFLACAAPAMFVGIQVMYEIREGEKRNGIDLKC